MLQADIATLEARARVVRRRIIDMIGKAGSGHPGGSLSAVDVLTVLFFHELALDPGNPKWEDRDRFVLSKAHAAPALYAVMAERGFFPVETLDTFSADGSILQKHTDMKRTPGLDASGGSLGQGLSIAVGMALGARIDNKGYRVYVMLGDGEVQEGQVWEAAMAAAHYKLDNLTAFLDRNGLQLDGATEDVMAIEPIVEKWKAFGWYVEDIDGHNMSEIIRAIDVAKKIKGRPTMIICRTVKGKGVSFMEGKAEWHAKAPTGEELIKALSELS